MMVRQPVLSRSCLLMNPLIVAACLSCLLDGKASAAAESPFIESYAGSIDAFLIEEFADGDAGMVIGLVDEHDRRVFSAGKLDNGTDRFIDGDTIFPLGSVTKVFTSLLLLDAVRRGEMGFEDPVATYLPKSMHVPSRASKSISLLNLAVQDSGLPFHPHSMAAATDPETGRLDLRKFKAAAEAVSVEELYASVSEFELTQTPGEKFQYSNVGMALLGNAIEVRTGFSYESLVVNRICRPLELADTRITLSPDQKSRLVAGHLDDGSRVGHWNFKAMTPAGGLFSTANDMLTFLAAQLGLSKSHLASEMKASHAIRHSDSARFGRTAMPWTDSGVYNPPGTELLGHAGHGFGGLAFVAFDTKNRRGVVVLTNQLRVHPNPIGWTLLQGMPFSRENLAYAVREVVGIGVGLKVDSKTGSVAIARVFPESPAGKAGLTADLFIRGINGTSVAGRTASECVAMMAGPAGKNIRLELFDPETEQTSQIELTKRKFLTVTGRTGD